MNRRPSSYWNSFIYISNSFHLIGLVVLFLLETFLLEINFLYTGGYAKLENFTTNKHVLIFRKYPNLIYSSLVIKYKYRSNV